MAVIRAPDKVAPAEVGSTFPAQAVVAVAAKSWITGTGGGVGGGASIAAAVSAHATGVAIALIVVAALIALAYSPPARALALGINAYVSLRRAQLGPNGLAAPELHAVAAIVGATGGDASAAPTPDPPGTAATTP